jgi:phosphoserine aminotransferase
MKKIHNFSPGPAILPRETMEAGSRACLDFQGTGLSLLEISHRSKEFESVMSEARD